jgi:hypothetical protein
VEAGLGAAEGVEGSADVHAQLGMGEALAGAAYGFLGALGVYFVGVLGYVG